MTRHARDSDRPAGRGNPVPLEYSIAWLIRAFVGSQGAVMAGCPDAQDRLPASSPDTRLALLVVRKDLAKDVNCWRSGMRTQCCAATSAGCSTNQPTGVVRRAGMAAPPRALERSLPRCARDAAGLARKLVTRKYAMSGLREPGRPRTVPGVTRLVVRLARENPL
jgi:hypothetical protein